MVDRINTKTSGLPPSWMSRISGSAGQGVSNTFEIRKMMGEPIPKLADPAKLPPQVASMFDSGGVLERLSKKLGALSKKKHKKLIPAHNTVACVDDEGNIYVGVEFLEQFGSDENLLAGILAHEWGHMMSQIPPGADFSHMSWDDIYAIRRDEEASADGFAGRALYMMGYKPDGLVDFLKWVQKRRHSKMPCFKYHNTATRVAIVKASFEAQENAMDTAQKIFKTPKYLGEG